MTAAEMAARGEDRAQLVMRAREYIRAHGQVPRTEHLSPDPGRAAWELLGQVLDVAEGDARMVELYRASMTDLLGGSQEAGS